jgi:hypothetical protein
MAAEELTLERFAHPQLGFTLDLPPGVEIAIDVPPGIALVARATDRAAAFRANLTVVAEQVAPDTDLDAYVAGSLAEQARVLEAWHLIDVASATVADRAAVRTLGHHVFDGMGIVVEQWRVRDADLGWVLAASSEALLWRASAEVLAACAESFDPRPAP